MNKNRLKVLLAVTGILASGLMALAPAEDKTLKSGVEYTWTPEEAKETSFTDLPRHFGTEGFPAHDPNYDDNLKVRIQQDGQVGNRMITFASNGDYCYYKLGEVMSYCYHSDGSLFKFGIRNKPWMETGQNDYSAPIRDTMYVYPKGDVMHVALYVAPGESFIFDPAGKLLAHWKGQYAYNDQGQVMQTRNWQEN